MAKKPKVLIWKAQVTIKIRLWERLPASKLNNRGWKPRPRPVQLVLSGKAENQISSESDTIEISLKNAMARDIKLFMPVSQGSSKLKQYFVHPHLAAIRMRVRVGAKLYLRRSNHDR